MIKNADWAEVESHTLASTMCAAHRIANTSPPRRAREAIRDLFFLEYRYIAGPAERADILDHFFERRARSRQEFLERLGLARDPDVPGHYLAGTWKFHCVTDRPGFAFEIHDVHATGGRMVAVPLSVKQYIRAASVLSAIRKAVCEPERAGLTAADWRRIWDGFDFRDRYGFKQRARGLRLLLIDQLTGAN
ncbi:MAG: hypothetical protein WCH40_09235 [Verrucomicrobiales bacterium]